MRKEERHAKRLRVMYPASEGSLETTQDVFDVITTVEGPRPVVDVLSEALGYVGLTDQITCNQIDEMLEANARIMQPKPVVEQSSLTSLSA